MELFQAIVEWMNYWVWSFGPSVGGEQIPLVVILLLGAGIFLTLRLGFVQFRRLAHGFAITSGKYDDPDEPGDVTHFQALTTALSATVGIGNIAGVAIAIHFGGPGALFWMWVTALLGMAVKFSEVTLAQHYRDVEEPVGEGASKWQGTVSGGPMYYIERGLGPNWKWLAMFFAFVLGLTAFLTGNAVQANTVADTLFADFGISVWITGLVTASIVALVILGGITRIGKVTSILAPLMAGVYTLGALTIILLNWEAVPATFASIFTEAFNPSAGVAGTGTGAFLLTLMWGVRRGLFSNEAGQGSAPIAHAAAKTDEPVSEGVVALLEPFIDTIVICTMTALVILVTGVWDEKIETRMPVSDIAFVEPGQGGLFSGISEDDLPERLRVEEGVIDWGPVALKASWHEVPVDLLYADQEQQEPFSGEILTGQGVAVTEGGERITSLYGDAVESGAPLTKLAFERGLAPLGNWGGYIVMLCVILFAISTAISWSYYGDRCANYLFGAKAVLPYKAVYVLMHFVGATLSLSVVWALGDVFLGIVILPNLLALVLLSGKIKEIMKSYFEREPWHENAEAHKRWIEKKKSEEHLSS